MTNVSATPVVLHLCGSAASEYYEGVSTYYSNECFEEVAKHGTYDNRPCIVHLDGTWSFPADMSEEAKAKAERLTIAQAFAKLAELKPAAMVPHMFCLPGMTTYRAIFDALCIPIVGNSSVVMGISTNKVQSKAIVEAAGVPVPPAQLLKKGDVPHMKRPFILKPCNEDNSQGITLVKENTDLQKALDLAFSFDYEVLCESYIELGRELRVAVLEKDDGSFQMLPCIEYFLTQDSPIRTPEHKLVTDARGVPTTAVTGGRKCPADIDVVLAKKLQNLAVKSHTALGCRDYSIYDVRVDPQGEPFFLEACLYCSFAPKSVIVAMAGEVGMKQREVYEMLVDRSIKRKRDADEQAADGAAKRLGMRA